MRRGPLLDITEVNEIKDLEPFRNDWNRLLAVTPGGSFFQSLEWLEVYWQHFSEKQYPACLCRARCECGDRNCVFVCETDQDEVGILQHLNVSV